MFLVVALSIIVFSQISLLRHGNGLSDAVRLRACPDHFDDDALVLAVTEFQKLRDPIDFIKCLLHKRPSLLDSMTEFGSALSEAAFLGRIVSFCTKILSYIVYNFFCFVVMYCIYVLMWA